MKRIILIAITLMISFLSQAQSKKNQAEDTSKMEMQIQAEDGKVVAYKKKDSALIIVDAQKTIQTLLTVIYRNNVQAKQIAALYNAAADVLSCINITGQIKDPGKFKEALVKYLSIIK